MELFWKLVQGAFFFYRQFMLWGSLSQAVLEVSCVSHSLGWNGEAFTFFLIYGKFLPVIVELAASYKIQDWAMAQI